MSSGLYSGSSGLALGIGLYRNVSGLWGGASGLIDGFGGNTSLPALDIDFTSGSLDSRITFTRASTATYVNSLGVITLAAVDEPRFDYFPDTLLPRGLLLEGQRSNILLNSLIDGTPLSTQSVSVTAQPYTLSFYGSGQVVLSGAASATVIGTGAYPSRSAITFTPSSGTLTLTVTGSVQYAQLEAGSWVSSFIPTAGAPATRSADSALMTGTNFSGWYASQTGTFVVGAETAFATSAQTPSILLLVDALELNYQALYVNGTTRSIAYSGAYSDFSLDFLTQAYSYTALPRLQYNLDSDHAYPWSVYGQAASYAVNQFENSGNGAPPAGSPLGEVPVYMVKMTIGQNDDALGYGGWFGWIRTLLYYSAFIQGASLQDLSAAASASPATLELNFLQQVYYAGGVPWATPSSLVANFVGQDYRVE